MKLFYAKGACSLIIRILLIEMGIPADYVAVNLKTKKTEHDEDYWVINPKGTVPALLLENAALLTENAVIMQYLADHYQATNLLPPLGEFARYRVLEWLIFISTELHKGFGPLFNPAVPRTLKDEIFIPILMKKFNYINQKIAGQTYLCGAHFTLPDAYLYVMMRWAMSFKLDLSAYQHLVPYWTQLQGRPCIVSALQQEGLEPLG